MVKNSVRGRAPRSGGGRAGTIFLIVGLLAMVTLGTVLIVYSVSLHGDAARTLYTQAHGVRQTARVISEDAGTGEAPTSTATVRLSEPVNGHDITTVYIQGAPAYSPGTPITVVVDPRDPGYAELPDAPYTTSAWWEIPLVIGPAVILVVPFGLGVRYLAVLRTRRRMVRFLVR
jgi:hypothetical protein